MKQTKLFALKVALPLVLTASLSHGAVTLLSSAGTTVAANAAGGIVAPHALPSGSSILVVAVTHESSTTGVIAGSGGGITYGGQALTQGLTALSTNSANQVSMWYLLNPLAANVGTDIVVTFATAPSAAGNNVRVNSAAFDNVTTAPVTFLTASTANAPSVIFPSATVPVGSMIYGAANGGASGTAFTTTSPTNLIGSVNSGQHNSATATLGVTTAGDTTFGFGGGSANAMVAVALIETIPEPSSMLLGAFGVLGLLRRRRA